MVWHAKPGCPEHHRRALERAVNAMPAEWRSPPATGESFPDLTTCYRRVQGFSLVEGFCIVKDGGGTKANPGTRFFCSFHGSQTKNCRKLEDRVSRDEEGNIVSQRKRETTSVGQSNCSWAVSASYKSVGKRNSGVKGYVLTVKSLLHSGHPLTDDPLMFPLNLSTLPEYQALKAVATQHRQAVIPYSHSRRVLDTSEDFGLVLTSRQYYNTVRNMKGDKTAPETISGLLLALEEAGFVYRTRVEVEQDDAGREIGRKLVQIWFTRPELIEASKRFVSDWLIVIDGTFNTNNLRMPILIAVGALNSGRTFPVAFSYCPSESKESFAFFWDSLQAHCFEQESEGSAAPAPPRVILGDQASGLIASIPEAFPHAQIQSCDWHVVQAMITHFRKTGGYSKADIDGEETEAGQKTIGLRGLAWNYIKSMTEREKRTSKQALLDRLQSRDRQYIEETWGPKEHRVLHLYTRFYPNLGSTSSQRVESYHPVMRQISNGQLSLEQSANRLCTKIKSIIKDLAVDEQESMRKYPRLTQTRPFESLRYTISLYAMRMLEKEWLSLQEAVSSGASLGDCHCEILLRFGIACKHYLLRCFRSGEPIPRSLLHPRWWLQGPAIRSTNWKPQYPQDAEERAEEEQAISGLADQGQIKLNAICTSLDTEARHRLNSQIEHLHQRSIDKAIELGERHLQLQQLPLHQPDAIPRRIWKKKKSHGKANARGLTAAEIAEQEMDAQAATQAMAHKETVITPPRPTPTRAPIPLAIRTPERRRPRRSPSPEDSPELIRGLPSTAPPRLEEGEGKGKRKRKHTARYNAAVDIGLLEASQHGALQNVGEQEEEE